MIVFITTCKGLEKNVAAIRKFENKYSLPKNSIMLDGVSSFNPKIIEQQEFAVDIMIFPPDGLNNSFGLRKGDDGSFAIQNSCINLIHKTTVMALQSSGFVTTSAVEKRLNSSILFDVHPFRYPSNHFSGSPRVFEGQESGICPK